MRLKWAKGGERDLALSRVRRVCMLERTECDSAFL